MLKLKSIKSSLHNKKNNNLFPRIYTKITKVKHSNISRAIDPEYAKVLEGTKSYSNYLLEHPRLLNKMRTKSLTNRLLGYHAYSINLGAALDVFNNIVSDSNTNSSFDDSFVRSMLIILNLQPTRKTTSEDFLLCILKFLKEEGASNGEIFRTLVKIPRPRNFKDSLVLCKRGNKLGKTGYSLHPNLITAFTNLLNSEKISKEDRRWLHSLLDEFKDRTYFLNAYFNYITNYQFLDKILIPYFRINYRISKDEAKGKIILAFVTNKNFYINTFSLNKRLFNFIRSLYLFSSDKKLRQFARVDFDDIYKLFNMWSDEFEEN